jgi:ATP-binding protein involved in chromosome partitioning
MALQIYQEKIKEPLAKIKKIIGIAAGKGGVGKSTMTVNLALALKKLGYSVGLLDTDIYGPSVRMMLPEDLTPKQTGDVITPALCRGIPMISMAYFRPDNQASVVRAPIANKIIKQFLNNVAWGNLDFLLVDFPPGTGDIQLTLSQEANLSGIIMVTTPQNVALMDVRKAMDMFVQVKVPVIGIIENMSYFVHEETSEKIHIFGKGGGSRLALESGVPFLGEIPLHSKICDYGDLGKSLLDDESHPTSKVFMEFANNFILHTSLLEEQSKESLQNFNVIWKEM